MRLSIDGGGDDSEDVLPILAETDDWDRQLKLAQEYKAIGFYLSDHPVSFYKTELKKANVRFAADLENMSLSANAKIKLAGVVTKITHRARDGKRFAYLQFSDPTSTTEVSVFNEYLLNDSRELIESEKPLIILSDVRKDEGGIRLSADAIYDLESYLQDIKRDVSIFVNSHAAIEKIIPLITPQKDGNSRVKIYITTPNNLEVSLDLQGLYNVPKDAETSLNIHKDICSIVEN